MEEYNYLVCVDCITYNQSSYIEDALNGFCMQETTFPFICTIVDDASTDDESDVINKYIQAHFSLDDTDVVRNVETEDYTMIFAHHKTNKNCFFVVYFLKYNHYQIGKSKSLYLREWHTKSKYISLCEGDDYWINPSKLQKQVDFMETHSLHSLCFCNYKRLFPSGDLMVMKNYENDVEQCSMEDIILGGGGYMATSSMLFRQNLFVSYQTWAPDCPIGDLPMMLSLAYKGSVGYLAEVMCVYRVASMGSWSSRMNISDKSRRDHYHAIKRMWHQFDTWSEFKYHKLVMKKLRKNQYSHYKSEIYRNIRKVFKNIL